MIMRKIKVGDLVKISLYDNDWNTIFWSWRDSQPREKVEQGLFLYVGEDKDAITNGYAGNGEQNHKFVWANDPHYYFTAVDEDNQNTWKWLQDEFRKRWGLTINTLN